MDNIKEIVKQVIGNISSKTFSDQDKLTRIWLNIVDKKENTHTRLVGFKDGCVFVDVDSPAWLYQMKINNLKILERLKKEIPEVKTIRFKIGKIS